MSLSKDNIRSRLHWIEWNRIYECPSICRLIIDTSEGDMCSKCAFLDKCKKIAGEYDVILG